jgi:hypothetical protein
MPATVVQAQQHLRGERCRQAETDLPAQPGPVVLDVESDPTAAAGDLDRDPGGGGVLPGIGDRFARRPKERRPCRLGERIEAPHLEGDLDG